LLIQFSGAGQTPFFWLYYLILLSVAVSVGVRYTLVLAAIVSAAYLTTVGVSIPVMVEDPKSLVYVWINIISLWIVGYLAAVLADAAERARHEAIEVKDRLEQYSKIDWLTGLHNMRQFELVASQEQARSDRYGRTLSLILVDSDHLKVVNDTYGHLRGDQLILQLSRTIVGEARAADTVIRYGGDEFVVVLPETDEVGARYMAERIRAAVEQNPLAVDGREVRATVSAGVASYPRDARDGLSLLARADAALRHSKQTGRNRVTSFVRGMEGSENGRVTPTEVAQEREAGL
jgi:diguanylate cyclase (GGDEF)-like protein